MFDYLFFSFGCGSSLIIFPLRDWGKALGHIIACKLCVGLYNTRKCLQSSQLHFCKKKKQLVYWILDVKEKNTWPPLSLSNTHNIVCVEPHFQLSHHIPTQNTAFLNHRQNPSKNVPQCANVWYNLNLSPDITKITREPTWLFSVWTHWPLTHAKTRLLMPDRQDMFPSHTRLISHPE